MIDADDMDLEPIVRAQGIALALVGTLLERPAGGVPKGEFSRLLGLMATLTDETDPEAGEILAAWTVVATATAKSLDSGMTQ